jgi:glycosyltransferase involved in cell wall biosynthesis
MDATALGSGRGGDETMLRGIIRGLSLTAEGGSSVTVLCPSPRSLGPDLLLDAVGFEDMAKRPGPVHFAGQLPRYLARNRSRFDVVLTITHAPVWSPVPVAHMVQDLSFLHLPASYPLGTRLRLRTLVGLQVRRACAVLTVSEFCRKDLIGSYRLDPSRVHVVPCSVEQSARLSDDREKCARSWLDSRGAKEPYLLYLGNLHPRKNVAMTIRAFSEAVRTISALSGYRLVIAGGRWWGGGEEAEAAASAAGNVIFLGRVDDDVRQILLEDAAALVYLSLFEGFGLPPLEAMAASTPVLASSVSAIPEVTGGAALLVDPLDQAAIAEAMGRICTDDGMRAELVELGRARVREFSPQATGAAVRKALASASSSPEPRPA